MAPAKKQKVSSEERVFLFSSESVNEGHPDKICDQVSDAILDACLTEDPHSKVACETAVKDNMVMVLGEITTKAKLDYDKIVRSTVKEIGFDSFVDDLSSVASKGLSCDSCEVLVRINKQSPDIAGGVHVGKDDLDIGAGDQGIMFGYASDETEDCMPLTHLIATRLGKKLTDVRKDGSLWWLRPDGKTQITIEYKQHTDGTVEPMKIHTIVISTQHAEPQKAKRKTEVAGYTGKDETAPSMKDMNEVRAARGGVRGRGAWRARAADRPAHPCPRASPAADRPATPRLMRAASCAHAHARTRAHTHLHRTAPGDCEARHREDAR